MNRNCQSKPKIHLCKKGTNMHLNIYLVIKKLKYTQPTSVTIFLLWKTFPSIFSARKSIVRISNTSVPEAKGKEKVIKLLAVWLERLHNRCWFVQVWPDQPHPCCWTSRVGSLHPLVDAEPTDCAHTQNEMMPKGKSRRLHRPHAELFCDPELCSRNSKSQSYLTQWQQEDLSLPIHSKVQSPGPFWPWKLIICTECCRNDNNWTSPC